jgi:hypothetical protein
MASDVATRDVPRFIRWSMITTAAGLGAGYAFGPAAWSSSPSFVLLKSISWFPIQAWGFSFLCAAILMAATRLAGYALAVVLWSTWGLCLWATALNGQLAGAGGLVWPFFFVAIAGYEVYRWGQKQLVRARNGPTRSAGSP